MIWIDLLLLGVGAFAVFRLGWLYGTRMAVKRIQFAANEAAKYPGPSGEAAYKILSHVADVLAEEG